MKILMIKTTTDKERTKKLKCIKMRVMIVSRHKSGFLHLKFYPVRFFYSIYQKAAPRQKKIFIALFIKIRSSYKMKPVQSSGDKVCLYTDMFDSFFSFALHLFSLNISVKLYSDKYCALYIEFWHKNT